MDTTSLSSLSLNDRILFQQYGLGDSTPVPFGCVHHAFEHHVRNQPEAIAVEDNLSETITYGELDRKANRLANLLRERDIKPGSRVCLLVRRSIPTIIAILAVLKAGAQYVPLDAVTITDPQLLFILKDSGAQMVLSMRDYLGRLAGTSTPVVCLEDTIEQQEKDEADDTKPLDLATPEDGIYVIYTSGTTGQPKGVDVRHSGVTNVVCLSPGNVGMRPGYRVAQLLNVAFDMCAWEILSSMSNGCTLCLRGNTSKEWRALMKTVDVVISTPSILSRHDPADYPNIKHVITGGEVCPQTLADRWAQFTNFNNCCGPTEISVANTVQPHVPGYPLSIGRPIPNTAVYILDEDANPLPIGEPGLMWVGGVGVSRGYLNLPEKNAERWKADPFLGGQMFNTGDMGRWRHDGQLDHLGRSDDQIKVKGFRVEPDGVASAMRACEGVSTAVVMLVDQELWGFATPGNVDLEAVRAATAMRQPYYAVPSQYLCMDEFPQTSRGKVDKRALKEMAICSTSRTPVSASPSSEDRRLSVPNKGIPFNLSLPGTPSILTPSCSPLPPSSASSSSSTNKMRSRSGSGPSSVSSSDSFSTTESDNSNISTPPPSTPTDHEYDEEREDSGASSSHVQDAQAWSFESKLFHFRESLSRFTRIPITGQKLTSSSIVNTGDLPATLQS